MTQFKSYCLETRTHTQSIHCSSWTTKVVVKHDDDDN